MFPASEARRDMTEAGRGAAQKDSFMFPASAARRDMTEAGRGAATSRSEVARPEGLEPSTPGLEGRCSIQLSYGRVEWR
jgi:hypothetical protein